MPKRWIRSQAGSADSSECIICTQSYQNGFSLKLNAAVQTMNSEVLLVMIQRHTGSCCKFLTYTTEFIAINIYSVYCKIFND